MGVRITECMQCGCCLQCVTHGIAAGILSLNGRDTRVAIKLVLPTDTAGNADVGAAARLEAAALSRATRLVPGAVLQLKGFLDAGNFLIAQEVPGSSLIKHLEKVINDEGGLKASTWVCSRTCLDRRCLPPCLSLRIPAQNL